MNIRPNKRRFQIGFYFLTGWMPWGTCLQPGGGFAAQDADGCWPICCGNVLRPDEVAAWLAAGLLVHGPDISVIDPATPLGVPFEDAPRVLRPTIARGPKLEAWVSHAWHNLQARRWTRPTALISSTQE